MKKSTFFLSILLLFLAGFNSYAQEFRGSAAREIVAEASHLHFQNGHKIPDFLAFEEESSMLANDFFRYLSKTFSLPSGIEFDLLNAFTDELGDMHLRYQANYQNIPIHNAVIVVHQSQGKVISFNGYLPSSIEASNTILLNQSDALARALEVAPADVYKWEIPAEEAHLKWETQDSTASYLPETKILLFPGSYPKSDNTYRYAYELTVYAHSPLFRKRIVIDAASGELILAMDLIQTIDVPGTAQTKYSGLQEITSDSFTGGFRLRESGRGNGINTYNLQNSTNYSAAVDFTDSDNFWNNFNAQLDEVATDAHWGSEMTYDYYFNTHNRNSIDNNGFALNSYVHYDVNYVNAFWDGQRMTYGDGDGSTVNPLTALDVVAHEITHGLTTYTADLDYAYESGAINESFSDIFGAAVEFYAKPNDANWTIGEDMNMIIRDMANPNAYGSPDTYQGNFWNFSSSDNGGVHTNSGIMNYWYHLLVEGGSGTNDLGNAYSVSSIGRIKADKIAYRTLVVYLTNTSQYADARFLSIMAAIDLYGACSSEVEAVTRAWYAVGVGPNYVNDVVADFAVDFNIFCTPGSPIQFTNNSINGLDFLWDFGDGTTSTLLNPVHTYNSFGNYTVSLIAEGGTCGTDTSIQTSFISIDPTYPCIANMGITGSLNLSSCQGTLFDSGGSQNYQDNTNASATIAPNGAMAVILNFSEFSFESGYDFLYIYDGPTTQSPLIGSYSGNLLPEGGQIISSGGAITIRQSSDGYLTESGFELTWNCVMPNTPPIANFSAFPLVSCDGSVSFQDISANLPNGWHWDFGDGNTSQLAAPTHVYQSDGAYTIQLIVENPYGTDTIVIPNFITVNMNIEPEISSIDTCANSSFYLSSENNQPLLWYEDSLGTELIDIQSEYFIDNLSSDLSFWVQAMGQDDLYSAGKPDNSGSGSNFTSAFNHHLVFDVYRPIKLVSVKVYSGAAANRAITIYDNQDNIVFYDIIFIPEGEQRIYLNADLPVGTDYRIQGPTSPNLFRNNGGTQYPYILNQLLSVKYSSAGNGAGDPDSYNYYYYFYDWEVIDASCLSEIVPVSIGVVGEVSSDFSSSIDGGTVQFSSMASNADHYTWDFGDGNSSVEVNPMHVYQALGDYTVSLTASNACFSQTATETISISELESDEMAWMKEVSIYPNPTQSEIQIELNNNVGLMVARLYNALGQEVLSRSFAGKQERISLAGLPAGIYQISLNNGQSTYKSNLVLIN